MPEEIEPKGRPPVSSAKSEPQSIPQGKFITIPVGDQDIGGQLLPILSKGLYTNPLDCVREYVQNSVDAGAKKITIKITGNSVLIHDTGQGMDEAQLLSSRKFGISAKDLAEHVGFRGIGIYSGYDLANRLVITTKKAESTEEFIMKFDFGGMKKELEANPAGSVPLSTILFKFTSFSRRPSVAAGLSFTTVQLEDISAVHLRKIANRGELRQYVLQNLPVDFSDNFDFKQRITDDLSQNVPGYRAVTIELQSDDEEDEIVTRPPLSGLREPSIGPIYSDGKVIAYYWACLNKANKRLDDENLSLAKKGVYQPSDYQGFIYKCKGFTIGTRDQLYTLFTAGSGTLYRWYTGEIYVIDDQVIPNTARADFETNAAKSRLEIAVKSKLVELEKQAEKIRNTALADAKVTEALAELGSLHAEISKKGTDTFEDWDKLRDVHDQMKKHRAKASLSVREKADQALKIVEKLEKEIRSGVNRGASTSQSAKRNQKSQPTPLPFPTEPPEPGPEKTLIGVLVELDLLDSSAMPKVVEAIDAALVDILGTDSTAYKRIITAVEATLQGEE
jgi:hypothetical protein